MSHGIDFYLEREKLRMKFIRSNPDPALTDIKFDWTKNHVSFEGQCVIFISIFIMEKYPGFLRDKSCQGKHRTRYPNL